MTDLLEKAVAKARDLSPDRQDEIARLMPAFVGDQDSVYRFTPEAAAERDESEATAARGDFATRRRSAPSGPSMVCEAADHPPCRSPAR